MNKIFPLFVIIIFLLFNSCIPPRIQYKPNVNIVISSDSVNVRIDDSYIRPSVDINFYTRLLINNKSLSTIYINKQLITLTSILGEETFVYSVSFLSDEKVLPQSNMNIDLGFKEVDKANVAYFVSNIKEIKKKHKVVINLQFVIGDNIVSKEIILKPK